MNISLLVLRCRDIEKSRQFYECLEMTFEKHKHGTGPEHYTHAVEYDGVFELYPARADEPVDRTGLGFAVSLLTKSIEELKRRGFNPELIKDEDTEVRYLVRDPDGRRVELKVAMAPF